MEQVFHEITINTTGQGLYDFTNKTILWLNQKGFLLQTNEKHSCMSEF